MSVTRLLKFGLQTLALIGMVLCSQESVFAGAWTQDSKGYYLKFSGNFVQTRSDFDAGGVRIPKAGSGQLTEFAIRGYLEYGIRNGLTLVASVPYSRLYDVRTFSTGIARERRAGFGDVEIRVKQRVFKGKRIVVSAAGGGKIPLWYEKDPFTRVPLSSKYSDQDFRCELLCVWWLT